MMKMDEDIKIIVCNYAESTSVCREGSKAYVIATGSLCERIMIRTRSRSGRYIEKWEDLRRLKDFRIKTIPPEHPQYKELKNPTTHQGYCENVLRHIRTAQKRN